MERALHEARLAAERGEVPIGAVIVGPDGTVLAEAGNRTEETRDPTAHAEMLAIRAAAAQARRAAPGRLRSLCHAGALPDVRPGDLLRPHPPALLGAADPKGGGVEHGPRIFDQPTCHHRPELYPGLSEGEAGELLRAFFKERR